MSVYVLDANIVYYYLKEDAKTFENMRLLLAEGHEIQIAPIAYYKVKRGLKAINALKRLRDFEELYDLFPVGALDNRHLDIATDIYASLRKKGKMIDDADIFIAAFCIINNYTLVTRNIKYFKNIDGLEYVNWLD